MNTVIIKEDLGWIQAMFKELGIQAIAFVQYNEYRLRTLMGCCSGIRAQHDALDIIEHCSMDEGPSPLTRAMRMEIGRSYAKKVLASLKG